MRKRIFIHSITHIEKKIPNGFAWNVLFGGFFIPLFDKQYAFVFKLWFIDLLAISITILTCTLFNIYEIKIASIIGLGVAFIINHIILPLFYNSLYIKSLLRQGFKEQY